MAVMAVNATLLPRDGKVQTKDTITVIIVALMGIFSLAVRCTSHLWAGSATSLAIAYACIIIIVIRITSQGGKRNEPFEFEAL